MTSSPEAKPSVGISQWPRHLVGSILRLLGVYVHFVLRTRGYLPKVGWFRSFREKRSVDAQGSPIPWITYPAISFLSERVKPDMTVFEFGSGNSSLWWSKRVTKVVACEHDRAWYDQVKRSAPANLELHLVDLPEATPEKDASGTYCQKVSEYHAAFDVISIDGMDRVACARACLPALKDDGVILWDNSDWTCWEEGFRFLAQNGFRRIDFAGMMPILENSSATAIFYRTRNCLGI